ncbi:MAG TPA: hypothetical protein VLH79_01130 [Chthonomonadales bacterium]|nr:hypothetical protein [Chthonomonadales bacterium]
MRCLLLALVIACSGVASAASQGQATGQATRITCYTAHDPDFFYIAAVVEKPELQATVAAHFADPGVDDSISLFLQALDGPVGSTRSARSIQMTVSAAGGAQLYRGAAATPLTGPQDFLQSDGIPKPFRLGVSRQPPTGGGGARFVVELAVPWLELGGPPQTSQRMRFNVVLRSAAAGSPPIVSLSPGVTTLADLQNPSLWTEIVFADTAVRAVPGAPDARVCARVFTARPVMDGVIGDAEWNRVTGFVFEATPAGIVTGGASVPLAAARTRPTTEHRPALPAIEPPSASPAPVAPLELPDLPRTVFALYRMDFQMDPRKALDVSSLWPASQPPGLRRVPEEGAGPWITFDRVDWHWRHLERARQAGIDVLVPLVNVSGGQKPRSAVRALASLVQARRLMEAAGVPAPQIAPCLDGDPGVSVQGDPVAHLYAVVRSTFLRIPPSLRARVPVRTGDRYEHASVLWLRSPSLLAGIEPSGVDEIRSRFRAEFSEDLVLVAPDPAGDAARTPGRWTPVDGRGVSVNPNGLVRIAVVGPGVTRESAGPVIPGAPAARRDGAAYRDAWRQAIAGGAQWVVVDSWNDYAQGSEIAPTDQDGMRYADMTRVLSRAFVRPAALAARALADTVPSALRAGSAGRASLSLHNAGTAAWQPVTHVVALSWRPSGGGSATNAVAPLASAVAPDAATTLSLTLTAPPTAGRYTLFVDVVALDRRGQPSPISNGPNALRRTIEVRASDAPGPAYAAMCLASDLPTALENGGVYSASVALRNDGSRHWSRGSRVTARLAWMGEGTDAAIASSGLSAELPNDVGPGEEVSLTVPVAVCGPDGAPLTPPDGRTRDAVLRWEVHAGEGPGTGAVAHGHVVELLEADIGVRFTMERVPTTMPGERRIPVPIGVRNTGPQTWRKETTRIGYHWYYQDGTLAVWEDETTPILRDLAPGEELPDLPAHVVAPPNDGVYWLVWDVKIGDTWASTLPSVRARETVVRQVRVVRGRLTFADLRTAFNTDVVSSEARPADGDFDGQGRSLPAEVVPPSVSADVTASGLFSDPSEGLESGRRIAFQWGPKTDGERNAIRATGQRVRIAPDARSAVRVRAVHLLAASTQPQTLASFTLGFADGSEQYSSMPIASWTGSESPGGSVAADIPFTRERSGALAGPVRLLRYTIRVTEAKPLLSITLPNSPDVRILAITLER